MDWPEPTSKPKTAGDKAFLTGFVVLMFGAFAAEMLRDFTPVKLSIVLFPVFYCLLTALHEVGHALAARLVGWRVEELVVGFGAPLKRFTVGGVPVEIRAIPVSGYVVPVPPDGQRQRAANAFIYLAGPGIELLLVALLAALLGADTLTSRSEDLGLIVAQTLCIAALVGAAINLIPLRTSDGTVTDGLGALGSVWLTEEHFARQALVPQRRRIEAELRSGHAAQVMAEIDALIDQHSGLLELHLLAARALVSQDETMAALMRLQAAKRMSHLTAHERLHIDELMRGIRGR